MSYIATERPLAVQLLKRVLWFSRPWGTYQNPRDSMPTLSPRTLAPLLLLALAALMACGEPDGKKLSAGADAHVAAATAALTAKSWVPAVDNWRSAIAIYDANPTVKAGEQMLAERKAASARAMAAAVDQAWPALTETAQANRDGLVTAQLVVLSCGSQAQADRWAEVTAPILLGFAKAEAEAAEKAKAERARQLASSYLLWVEGGVEGKQREVIAWRETLATALRAKLAPAGIEVVESKTAREQGLGTIRVQLDWERVGYARQSTMAGMSMPSDYVAVGLDGTITIATRGRAANIDGRHTWRVAKDTPGEVKGWTVSTLADAQRKALLTMLNAKIEELPALADGDAVIAAAAAAPPKEVWTYTITSRATVDQPKTHATSYDYTSFGEELVDALRGRCPTLELVNAKLSPEGATGSFAIDIRAEEKVLITQQGSIRTMHGTMPARMTVTITATADRERTTSWPQPKVYTAQASPLGSFDKNAMEVHVTRAAKEMIAAVVEKIGREGVVVVGEGK